MLHSLATLPSVIDALTCVRAASGRNTPGLLFKVAFALYTVAPAAVYFIPDDSAPLIVAQVTQLALHSFSG